MNPPRAALDRLMHASALLPLLACLFAPAITLAAATAPPPEDGATAPALAAAAQQDESATDVEAKDAVPSEVAPKAALLQDDVPTDAAPKDAAAKGEVPTDAAPKAATPKVTKPKEAAPKDAAAKDDVPTAATPKAAAPRDAVAKAAAAKVKVPKAATPQDTAPGDAVAKDAAAKNDVPKAATPKAAAPRDAVAKAAAAKVKVPTVATPKDAAPEDAAPEDASAELEAPPDKERNGEVPDGAATTAATRSSGALPDTRYPEIRALDTTATVTADPAPPEPAAPAAKPAKRVRKSNWGAIEILGSQIGPGRRRDLYWTAGQSFAGSAIETPIVVIRGRKPGPTLCLTAAIHGDELNGVEIVRRVLAGVDERELAGTIIGAPIVNLLGFSRGSRYLPDRRDLNRYFPGRAEGSLASRIAHAFFNDVVRHCERLVDFHTGSFKRTNLPQLRANLKNPLVREFVERFGATAVLHKAGGRGTLRYAANAAGIPTVTFELGEPGTLQIKHVRFGVRALDTLLDKLGMVERFSLWSEPQPVFYRSSWLRAYRGGILTSNMRVGASVSAGDVLGIVTNPLTSEESTILSPHNGRLLGRALDQFVLPGFATFHIGIETREVADAAVEPASVDDEYGDDDLIDDEAGAPPMPDGSIEDVLDEEIH